MACAKEDHDKALPNVGRSAALFAVATVLVDQVSKAVATGLAAGHTSGAIVPLPNPELSLGLARASVPVTVVACALGIVAFGGYAVLAALDGRLRAWVPGFLVGGALSNLLDRVVVGAVRDFLATPWVIVNVADVAVVAGVLGFLAARGRPRPFRGEVIP